MTLQEAIKEIISQNYKTGDIFDSHSVIFLLSRNEKYAETYMKNISPEMNTLYPLRKTIFLSAVFIFSRQARIC